MLKFYQVSQNYQMFYDTEIELRKQLNYPPFCDIIMVRFNGENIKEIQRVSKIVYDKINNLNEENILIYKPVPSPIDKIKNKYRWRMIIKCKLTSRVLDILKYATNVDGLNVNNTSIVVDINPNSMM